MLLIATYVVVALYVRAKLATDHAFDRNVDVGRPGSSRSVAAVHFFALELLFRLLLLLMLLLQKLVSHPPPDEAELDLEPKVRDDRQQKRGNVALAASEREGPRDHHGLAQLSGRYARKATAVSMP